LPSPVKAPWAGRPSSRSGCFITLEPVCASWLANELRVQGSGTETSHPNWQSPRS
jgi:hypothetical protein